MNIGLEELHYAYLAFGRLGEREGLKAAPSWWIASAIRKLRPDYDAYLERREVLFERFGERQPDPSQPGREVWAIRVGSEIAFNEEHLPLLEERIEVGITCHTLSWLGAGIAGSIEPDILYRLRSFLEEPAPPSETPPATTLSRLEAEEAYSALSVVCLMRMEEGLAWWFADLLGQVENAYKATALERQGLLHRLCKVEGRTRTITPEYREANSALGRQRVEFVVAPRPFEDLGELTLRWPPALAAAVLPFFSGPAEDTEASIHPTG